ncbi:MAG: hypothetical protein L6R00_02620 [Phycisphaerae bacterium]|nr:hypothetical protein [Phycisphaerae bacterium]
MLRAMLQRPKAVGILRITVEFQQHPDRDAGCRLRAHEFLKGACGRFQHALVVFDREGCGAEDRKREDLEREVEHRLGQAGWCDRAAVVVIDPELEVWIWVNSSHLDATLGWAGRRPTLREWLAQGGFLAEGAAKPQRPKQAIERALRKVGKTRSSAIYAQLAARVSFARCVDPAFIKLRTTLQRWFAGS